MVMGIVARNQLEQAFGRELSKRFALELGSVNNTQPAAALLTALGNTGDNNNQSVLQSYLAHDDPLLRQRSAAALGRMPNTQATENLSRLLATETNPEVQEAALSSLSGGNLQGEQLSQVFEYASRAEQSEVRNAAIAALSGQMETQPAVKSRLRKLLKTDKNRANLRKILSAIY
jgi:HEAT repeat protein